MRYVHAAVVFDNFLESLVEQWRDFTCATCPLWPMFLLLHKIKNKTTNLMFPIILHEYYCHIASYRVASMMDTGKDFDTRHVHSKYGMFFGLLAKKS